MVRKRIYISIETLTEKLPADAAVPKTVIPIPEVILKCCLLMQKGFDVVFFYTGHKLNDKPSFESRQKWLSKYFWYTLPQGQKMQPVLIYIHSTEILKGHVLIDSKPHKPGDQPFDGTLLIIGQQGHYKNWTDLYDFIIKNI